MNEDISELGSIENPGTRGNIGVSRIDLIVAKGHCTIQTTQLGRLAFYFLRYMYTLEQEKSSKNVEELE